MAFLVPDDLWAVIEPLLLAARPSRRAVGRRCPTAWHSPVPCTCCEPASSDTRCRTSWAAAARPAGGGCAIGIQPTCGPPCTGHCWRACKAPGGSTGTWPCWTAPAFPRKNWPRRPGPKPTDRGKPGTKRYLIVYARGTPLGIALSGANRHDSRMSTAILDAVPPVRDGSRGRSRRRPAKLHADEAYVAALAARRRDQRRRQPGAPAHRSAEPSRAPPDRAEPAQRRHHAEGEPQGQAQVGSAGQRLRGHSDQRLISCVGTRVGSPVRKA